MKILFITPTYLPKQGGVEIFLSELINYFYRQGHEVKVITQKYPQALKAREIIDKVEILRYLYFDPKPPAFTLRSIAAYIYTFCLAPLSLVNFFRAIDRYRPDIINYHFPGAVNFFLLLYLKFRRSKCIVSLHGSDILALPYESRTSRKFLREILKRANFVTANSRYILKKAELIEESIIHKSKVIYNGTDRKFISNNKVYRPGQGKYVFAMGRFFPAKGFDVLIKAFKRVYSENKEIALLIAGDGPNKKELKKLIKKLEMEEKIQLLGWIDRKQVADYIRGSEFVILPSRSEGFGLVIIESWAAGKPIIATTSGGPEEIVKDGFNGMLVSEDSPQDLAEAVSRLLKDRNLLSELVAGAKASMDKFDIKDTGEEYLEAFKK